ncbi:MAG: ATP-binding cassette domain-containing protein [Clostridiales Family XIII bacterium]|jgi:molybdate transport system ATP-binding protein|nr:ATP-binding cassette domain-containing protein [Clostridiales Family XIII bacterium]
MSIYVDIKKSYKDFTLEVAFDSAGGTVGILGASGSGKSLTLKCIAGLISPDEGVIRVGGRTVFDSAAKIDVPPQQRDVGYLFQSYALFPHMTVYRNIAEAARCRSHRARGKAPTPGWRDGTGATADGSSGAGAHPRTAARASDVDTLVRSLLERYELTGFENRYPAALSGGQQQRVALARIFAYEPEILLLDEPFAALDAFLRENMQAQLIRILHEYEGDALLVTHSRDEAYRICPQLVVMRLGRILARGKTSEVFARPEDVVTARVTGCKNLSAIRPLPDGSVYAEDWGCTLDLGKDSGLRPEHTHIGVRAHFFTDAPGTQTGRCCQIPVEVEEVMDGAFDRTVILRVKSQAAEHPASYYKAGAYGRLWWICDRKTKVEGIQTIYIDRQDILLLRS